MTAAKQSKKKSGAPVEMDHEVLLQTLLHELQNGVIVCAPDATISLFNQAAEELLGGSRPIIRGDSLYSFCLKPPVENGLDLLQYQKPHKINGLERPPTVQFVTASVNQERFFRCRLNFLPSQKGNSFFLIIFEDISAWHRPDNPLLMKTDAFRAPMTNLRAAVENITEHAEMSPVMRSAFENVLVQELLNLTVAFESMEQACNILLSKQGHLTEIDSAILCSFIADHFSSKTVNFSKATGPAVHLKVDSYGLLLVLDYLADKIKEEKKLKQLSCEAHAGEKFVYFDFTWTGEYLPTTTVEAMLGKKLTNSVGELTVAEILHSMGGDMWSQQHENSKSTLRLALPLVAMLEK